MTTDKATTEWSELKGKIKTKWSKLIDTDIDGFKGNLDLISAKIQKAYGYTKDVADQEYKDFKKGLEPMVAKPVETNTASAEKAKPN